MQRQRHQSTQGSALVTTLLVIVVLTIIITAFLQSMMVERQTAHSYLNRYRAELAARAALAEAMQRLEAGAGDSQFHFVVSTEGTAESDPKKQYLQLRPLTKDKATLEGNPIDLASLPKKDDGATGETYDLDLTPQGKERTPRTVVWKRILDAKNTEQARYAFWVDAASSKQDAGVHSGVFVDGDGTEHKRDALEHLAEVPLVKHDGEPFTADQRKALEPYQYDKLDEPRKPILTAATLNQIVAPSPEATERDFTLDAPTVLLTPEGKPRLNLQRLKCYIDGDEFKEYGENGGVIFSHDYSKDSPAGLPVDQGPNSPRFLLVQQLLNEDGVKDGPFPADKENPWGYGNLEIVRKIFPKLDANNKPTQARQFVANLIDYIDADIIPTTDGSAGIKPTSGSVSGAHPSLDDFVIKEFPIAPTVLGVEARKDKDLTTVRGHPYITYVGQGFIWNAASTRVLGFVGMAYPWSSKAPLGKGTSTIYQVEMQVSFSGTATGGRGPDVMSESSSSPKGYLLHGWLAQESNFTGKYNTASFAPNSYVLFPRGLPNSGAFDLANGFFSCGNPSSITFSNLVPKIEVLRLIYREDFIPERAGKRFIVQDLSVLGTDPKLARPEVTFKPSSLNMKLGDPTYGIFTDWHYIGDPRLNFLADDWKLKKTVLPTTTTASGADGVQPAGDPDIYASPLNDRKDPPQGMPGSTTKWFRSNNDVNPEAFFPKGTDATQSDIGYRPSPAGGLDAKFNGDTPEPAMLSYAELGFISAGAPWETLTLFNDPARFKDADRDHADWLLLDYVDIGTPPRHLNYGSADTPADQQREAFGQINVNAGNRATLRALLQDVGKPGDISNPSTVVDALLTSSKRPFLSPADVFVEPAFKNDLTKDADREKFAAQVYPALTAHSQRFTVHTVGEARDRGRTVSHVTLAADVELRYTGQSNGTPHLKPAILRTYTP